MDLMAKAEEASDAMEGFTGYCEPLFSKIGSVVSLIATLVTILGLTNTVTVFDKGNCID